jgi:hypothetical protein
MPVHAVHTVKAGTTSKSFLIYARAALEAPGGKTGLAHDMPGAGAAYFREGATRAEVVELVPGRVGEYVEGGFVEIDPDLLPGVYQFGVPDAILAVGSTRAMLVFRFPDAVVEGLEIDLVAYDPHDEKCIGMTQLSDERRHEFLRRALPRLTEQELALGEAAEQALARRTSQRPRA